MLHRQRDIRENALVRPRDIVAHDVHSDSNSRALRNVFVRAESSLLMLSHCANAKCHKPFLRLREGKLFLVETDRLAKPGAPSVPPFVRARQQPRHVEHYWLCDACATQWTLIYDRELGVALAPVKRPITSVAAAATAQNGVA